jgi:sterol 24-C-methyltransferase
MRRPLLKDVLRTSLAREAVQPTIDAYEALFRDDQAGGGSAARKAEYARMVNHYYDLATDFYEFGWGHSFHFAPRGRTESFEASLARYEMFVALRGGFGAGMRLLDVGCGVGGPMRTIARFTGAHVTGVTINGHQVGRGRQHNEDAGLSSSCEVLLADFHHLPMGDTTFDGAYEIEATCHAPDRVKVYREILRVLKPGGSFVGYEWCMTSRYDPGNAEHRRIKHAIAEGTGLPDLITIPEVLAAFESAGFEIVSSHDHALTADAETPWWQPLVGGGYTAKGFARTSAGRTLTNGALRALESARIVPEGTVAVSSMLNRGADALIAGGRAAIFTPMLFHHVRRPRTAA